MMGANAGILAPAAEKLDQVSLVPVAVAIMPAIRNKHRKPLILLLYLAQATFLATSIAMVRLPGGLANAGKQRKHSLEQPSG